MFNLLEYNKWTVCVLEGLISLFVVWKFLVQLELCSLHCEFCFHQEEGRCLHIYAVISLTDLSDRYSVD